MTCNRGHPNSSVIINQADGVPLLSIWFTSQGHSCGLVLLLLIQGWVCTQGIRATEGMPNPHLFQSIAVLAGEMGYVEEARRWFREGTRTIKGKQSHALWHAWAIMEAAKVAP